jgi:hypothetical protein
MTLPNKRVKLSFEDDEEEEDTFLSSKAKAKSKAVSKRIFQATTISEEVPTITATISGNGSSNRESSDRAISAVEAATKSSYSKAALAELRTKQNFSAVSKSASDDVMKMDVVELSGDQAEALEEQLYGNGKRNVSDEFKSMDVLLAGKRQQQKNQAQGHAHRDDQPYSPEDRVYTSNLLPKKESKLVSFDSSIDVEPAEWEDEIIRRGVLHASAQPREEDMSAARLGIHTRQRASNQLPTVNDVMIMDIIESVQASIDQLRSNLDDYDRRTTVLQTELSLVENKCFEQERLAEQEYERLHAIEESKRYFPNVIGMLREKEPYLEELLAAWHSCLERQANQRKSVLCLHQEDLIFRVRSAGELLSMDSSYSLATDSVLLNKADEMQSVDEFGRQKPLATIDGKMYFTVHEALNAREEKLYRGLQAHIYLSDLDELPLVALRKQRWELLSIPSTSLSSDTKTDVCALYMDALLHCLQPMEWSYTWQNEVQQVHEAMQTLMNDVAFEVMSLKEIFRHASRLRSLLPDTYYEAYFPLSLAQVISSLTVLDTLPHTHGFFHPRDLLGTREIREDLLESQYESVTQWSWVQSVLQYIRNAALLTSVRERSQLQVQQDSVILQQLLEEEGSLWQYYYAAFFSHALDFSSPRSCHHARDHICMGLFRPDILSKDFLTDIWTTNLENRVGEALCHRLVEQWQEIALPVCLTTPWQQQSSLLHPTAETAHNLNHAVVSQSSTAIANPKAVDNLSGDTDSGPQFGIKDDNITTLNTVDCSSKSSSSSSSNASRGASNFQGGRMMFVSASSSSASVNVSTASSCPSVVPSSVPNSSTSNNSHQRRMGLGFQETSTTITHQYSLREVIEKDIGLGVSVMSWQVQRMSSLLRHFTQYFLGSYVLFIPPSLSTGPLSSSPSNTQQSQPHSLLLQKRVQRVSRLVYTHYWQRCDPVLRKLARVPARQVKPRFFLVLFVLNFFQLLLLCRF